MNHSDDAGESVLAEVDLHAWRVPPPIAAHRPAILVRALSPAEPARRSRTAWLLAAILIMNAALAAIVVIVISRPPAQPSVLVRPAGGSVDPEVRELLQRLEDEQRELERRLAEVQELRALVEQLSEKVRQYEGDKRQRPAPKPRRVAPDPVPPEPLLPSDLGGSCDEVACVLTNYEAGCCLKYRRRGLAPTPKTANAVPDALDRQMISHSIAQVKGRVQACRGHSTAAGMVKARIRVDPAGHVTNVVIETTSDPVLASCVARELQKATFQPTVHGGSFSYPFVF